mmetsp:Transcript_35640/g.54516  ORF Transcript_35640/g.54516 Transcript_35640/m.54516 type:complete len:222 (+) Transcript_35640:562-1227(+)
MSQTGGVKWHYFWWVLKLVRRNNPGEPSRMLIVFTFQVWVLLFVALDLLFTGIYAYFYVKYLYARFGPDAKDESSVITKMATVFLERLYSLSPSSNPNMGSEYYIKMGKYLAWFSILTFIGFIVKTLSGLVMIKNKFRARHVTSYFQLAFTLNCAFLLQYQEQYFALSRVFETSYLKWVEKSVFIFLPLVLELWMLSNFVRRLDQENNIYNVLTRNRKVSY